MVREMSDLIKRHKYFFFAALLVVLVFMAKIYQMGFGAMAVKADASPERLRDFTFPVWQQYSFLKHGFLVFLSSGDFESRAAYSNHSTAYLLFMNVLFRLQLVYSGLSMRISGAYTAMAGTLLVIGFIGFSQMRDKFELKRGALVVLGLIYFLTMPTYWISVGKFNVDNVFIVQFPILILLAYKLSYGQTEGRGFWILSIIFGMVGSIISVLLGLFLLLKSCQANAMARRFRFFGIFFIILGGISYLGPVLVSKFLGFKSQNSSWLFRSGLDGDVSYYSNFFNSVFFPQFSRPYFLLIVPAGLLLAQLIYSYISNRALVMEKDVSRSNFLQILFSIYVLTLLFWPQAVSIHPYLYDYLLIGPIVVWIILNFSLNTEYMRHFVFWVLLMLFLVMFNVTEIAQAAHCKNCYFPAWDMSGPRAGVYLP